MFRSLIKPFSHRITGFVTPRQRSLRKQERLFHTVTELLISHRWIYIRFIYVFHHSSISLLIVSAVNIFYFQKCMNIWKHSKVKHHIIADRAICKRVNILTLNPNHQDAYYKFKVYCLLFIHLPQCCRNIVFSFFSI